VRGEGGHEGHVAAGSRAAIVVTTAAERKQHREEWQAAHPASVSERLLRLRQELLGLG